MRFQSVLIAALLAAGALSSAQAHQIWLEQPAQGPAMLRFGEFGDNLRERSPGLLDKFAQPLVVHLTPAGEQPVTVTKTADGFALPGRVSPGETLLAQETAWGLFTKKEAGKETKAWYFPSARLVTSLAAAQAPRMPLDLVPAGAPGTFRLYFKGQPLAKTKVEIVTPAGWSKQAQTGADGTVRFDMPWSGTYVVEAMHADHTPGERQRTGAAAERYDSVSYVTTLTYDKPDGLPALPPGPAAPAN